MHDQDRRAVGFLTRLKRDTRGNTLAIVGAALVPLAAMIGSGLDMSRAYMAKTRLQNACDAASLAARRVMTEDQINDAVRAEANRFFAFNFPQGLYDTETYALAVTRPQAGSVAITTGTRIPTTIMSMFGIGSLPLNVSCEASLNFVNTDIMLVLDVTGSMGNNLNGVPRINSLRDAVMALYDELTPVQQQLESNGLRLRYGIVPYSSTVNVGRLIRQVSANHIVDNANYQSRSPLYVQSQSVETFNNQNNNQCNNRAVSYSGNNVNLPYTEKLVSRSQSGVCTVTTRILNRQSTSTFSGHWIHEQRSFSTSSFKNPSNSVQVPSREPGTSQNSSWNGCIEERNTVSTITAASGFNIPATAFDLDINLIPHNDATRWRPMWPQVEYRRSGGSTTSASGTSMASTACPAEARRLDTWTRANMQTYVNGLTPTGNTYHDIGMIWGARMVSNAGIFADSPDVFNGMPVNRHIIFMTDGQLEPSTTVYSSYGVEVNDQRITNSSSGSGQYDRHLQRFRMICNATRSMDVSVWVIAFGTTLSVDMRNCASNASQASTSTNRDELIARFRQIGNQIGALRLTQ